MLPLGAPQRSSSRALVIACAAVMEEIRPHLPPGTPCHVLDFGLHADPPTLRRVLQEAINHAAGSAETIILGYGLCSMAVVGLQATGCTLVEMPRNRARSFCCGAGGGLIWMQDVPMVERPSENRIREAVALPGVDRFVVACPKDLTMYQDAIKTTANEARIQAIDLIELVYEAL